eukprot:scaffold15780_cov68-Phaeocystis_antarctica.AAC.4
MSATSKPPNIPYVRLRSHKSEGVRIEGNRKNEDRWWARVWATGSGRVAHFEPARQREFGGRGYVVVGDVQLLHHVRVGTLILEHPLQPHDRTRPRGHRSTGAIAVFEAAQAHGLSVERERVTTHRQPRSAASL